MVKLEQIRALEARVEKAVVLIDKLRKENAELEQRLLEASGAHDLLAAENAELKIKLESLPDEDFLDKLSQAEARCDSESRRRLELEELLAAAKAEAQEHKARAEAAQAKASELEASAEEFKSEQLRIEEGLAHALSKLDAFEDMVMGITPPSTVEEGPKPSESAAQEADTQKEASAENELDIF